ncbi:MAG: CinA family protein [Betaproteobacteria bacterium]|nr:CinA family protein [Betaproteobacteria bacterium]
MVDFHSPADAIQEYLEKIAAELGDLLLQRGARMVTAESCTGGWAAQTLTAVPGSSAWFERGFVVYANEAKCEMLGVFPATLEREGSVSVATAQEMALGALAASRAGWSVAMTGIAGPGGGSAEKPVGTVCIAWAKRDYCDAATFRFSGIRRAVRAQAVAAALEGLATRIRADTYFT